MHILFVRALLLLYATLLSGLVAGTKALCEVISRDMFWSYIIMANLFTVLLIEYVSSIRSSIMSSMPVI